MFRLIDKEVVLLFLLGAIVFLSRVPFLGAGYGVDPDAWRMVRAARSIAATGEYSVSRFPGYPLPEMVMSLFADSGPFILNGLTALLSAVAVLLFALILRHLKFRQYLLASYALAATPVIFVNSVTTMDYVWGLAFVLAAFLLVLKRLPFLAGIALGMAAGCRLTSGIMIIPLLLLLFQQDRSIGMLLKLIVSASIIGLLMYLPVFMVYGTGFIRHYGDGYPGAYDVLRRMTVHVWGRTGLFAVVSGTILVFISSVRFKRNRVRDMLSQSNRVWWTGLGLITGVFLILPHEAGYLVPAVPFMILLLASKLRSSLFVVVCICVIIAPFGQICRSDGICAGPVISSHMKRRANAKYVQRIIEAGNRLPEGSVVLVSWWLPQIELSGHKQRADVRYEYLLDSTMAERDSPGLTDVYYLNGVPEFNLRLHGIDLSEFEARPLFLDQE